jgi:hypothetical protein
MMTIAKVTAEILYGDEVAREALISGVLNLSAYAKKIQPLITKRLYKNVRVGSIVTSLSRLASFVGNTPSLKAEVKIEDMSLKSPLCELTYEASSEVGRAIASLQNRYVGRGFFTVTQGIGETTLITAMEFKEDIRKAIGVEPKGFYDHLAAVTVRFVEAQYIEVPNMIYTMVAALATKRINLIEIVSTFTEISFIVRQNDMNAVVDVFRENFLNG